MRACTLDLAKERVASARLPMVMLCLHKCIFYRIMLYGSGPWKPHKAQLRAH